MTNEEQGRKMGLVISKAWADEAFKRRLLADATAVLKEEGVTVPDGVEIRVVANTETTSHFVLPAAPSQIVPDALLEELCGGLVAGHMPILAKWCWSWEMVIKD